MTNKNWEEDPRFKQCNREFILTLALFLLNVILVIGISTLLGHGVSGKEMPMVFGLPSWIFWGGFGATGLFIIASILMVIFFFKDMSLEAHDDSFEDETKSEEKGVTDV